MHLDDVVDGNSPFKLYKRNEPAHFVYDDGVVDLDSPMQMPGGIGVETERFENRTTRKKGSERNTEKVLIDPMTREIISKVSELDDNGERVFKNGKVVYKPWLD